MAEKIKPPEKVEAPNPNKVDISHQSCYSVNKCVDGNQYPVSVADREAPVGARGCATGRGIHPGAAG